MCQTIVGQWKNNGGYLTVKLSRPRKDFTVHRLVADAFIDKDESLLVVNHKDFNIENNSYKNLEWCTQAHNIRHSLAAGRYPNNYWVGKRSANAKLSDEVAEKIRYDYEWTPDSYQDLADKYGTNKKTVMRIVNGESYVRVQ